MNLIRPLLLLCLLFPSAPRRSPCTAVTTCRAARPHPGGRTAMAGPAPIAARRCAAPRLPPVRHDRAGRALRGDLRRLSRHRRQDPAKAGRTAGIRRQAQRSGGAAVGELDLVNLGNLSLSGPDQAGIALSQRYFSSAPSSRRSPPNRARCCCRASGSPPCRVMWTRPPSSATTRIWCWSTTPPTWRPSMRSSSVPRAAAAKRSPLLHYLNSERFDKIRQRSQAQPAIAADGFRFAVSADSPGCWRCSITPWRGERHHPQPHLQPVERPHPRHRRAPQRALQRRGARLAGDPAQSGCG